MGCFNSTPPVNESELKMDSANRYKLVDDMWKIYEYKGTIAKGGSCDVLQVKHQTEGDIYAAKELHEWKHKVQRLFEREVDIFKQLDKHPNIVNFKQAYKDKKNFFIVSEFLSGGELFDRIVASARNNQYSEEVCAKQVQMMLSALKHLHDHNIVHRDLKPENFVFKSKAKDSPIIMIDFGSALICPDPDKKYREVCGTPYYMPPEAIKNLKRNRFQLQQGDMFAIGVITYIMMSGVPPFPGATDDEIFRKIKKGEYHLPKHVKWSEGLKSFVRKCLVSEPAKRCTCDQALFNKWVTGTTVSHKPVDLQILGSLRKFVAESRLQKAIVNLMVANVDDKDNTNLERMFRRLDQDQNNKVTENEMYASLIDDGMYAPEAKKQAKKILSDVDTDGNGYIDFDEFVKARARNKLSTDQMVLHAVFNLLDVNGDQEVSKEELQALFEKAGLDDAEEGGDNQSPDDQYLQQMISEVDTNNDQQISYDEFWAALAKHDALKQFSKSVRRSVGASDDAIARKKGNNTAE